MGVTVCLGEKGVWLCIVYVCTEMDKLMRALKVWL